MGRLIDADALEQKMLEREEELGDDRSMWESSAVSVALDMFAPTVKAYTIDEVINMLYDLTYQIQELEKEVDSNQSVYWWKEGTGDSIKVIQNRIDILKAVKEKENKNES